ncbi:MAG: dihydrolipoyllysine-residue acetyltransferase [Rhodocyclaceae bacterium]|nr:dihydrolipoyllysine-residue acetyltransferase [Rhodocyclaceae bacterium]MDZ4216556.1 dihydrolipoyllysine-residue acetyltransferase [Rhodocyclaceae bacterium]
MIDIKVPDIGDFKDVPVIEIHVKPGDTVKADDSLVTLESDKATMDVPAPVAGVVKEIKVAIGDKVAEGSVIVVLEEGVASEVKPATPAPVAAPAPAVAVPHAGHFISPAPTIQAPPATVPPATGAAPPTASIAILPPAVHIPTPAEVVAEMDGIKPHASPSVRRFARELGVDVAKVKGSGPKGRITQQDVQGFVKGVLSGAGAVLPAPTSGGGFDLLPWPKVDFAKFGPVEVKPLSRIKKISGPNLARNWVMIPAVTYHEDADITDLEALRVQLNKESEKSGGTKVTMLAFMIKACVAALKKYPDLNSSLDGESQVYKNYWHIGFAADTPNGLMVPVLKNADQKGVFEIAQETSELAKKAREGKLPPADMQGATFTISSVGGIGGTAFSPIVNAPEVAILGISKSAMKPVWDGKAFVPRLIVPLSLSADHRVVDGALATRFNATLAQLLSDFRRVML